MVGFIVHYFLFCFLNVHEEKLLLGGIMCFTLMVKMLLSTKNEFRAQNVLVFLSSTMTMGGLRKETVYKANISCLLFLFYFSKKKCLKILFQETVWENKSSRSFLF